MKLISEAKSLIYQKNLPTTYIEFIRLNTKILSLINLISRSNNFYNLKLDNEIATLIEQNNIILEPKSAFTTPTGVNLAPVISDLTPREFEIYVAEQFKANGYEYDLTPYYYDDGIDVIIWREGKTYGVQCKHFAQNRFLGVDTIFSFLGSLVNMNADGGFLVYTGKISQQAEFIAARNNVTIIKL